MSTPKWITITWSGSSPSGKTNIYLVRSAVDDGTLGFVAWYAPWRKYAFRPSSLTIFEEDCLRDIATFCEETTRAHRAALKESRT